MRILANELTEMIPTFPTFKKPKISDAKNIENYTQRFPPYSDFNFVSMFSYNTDNRLGVSLLNQNLVVRFSDYLSRDTIYSFIGTKNITVTVRTLIEHLRATKNTQQLKLVPEVAISPRLHKRFLILEDKSNFDYIISLKRLSSLNGKKYSNKRNLVNRLYKTNPTSKNVFLDLGDPRVQKHILGAFEKWEKSKKKNREHTNHEYLAIKRLLRHSSHFNLLSKGIYINNKLMGFSIAQVLYDKYAIFHFVKGDITYKGIFEALYHEISKELVKKGCELLNIEQDFAFPGIRQAKMSWRPVKFLKKYTISPKNSLNLLIHEIKPNKHYYHE